MANTILLKRDDTPGKKPVVSDLDLGELAYNTHDGRLYAKRLHSHGSPIGGSPLIEEIVIIGDPSGKTIDILSGPILSQTGTTEIPYDDTTPLNTEGTEIGSGTITTEKITDHISIDFSMSLESSVTNTIIIISVFRDTVCIGAIPVHIASNNAPNPFSWRIEDDPYTAGAITYSGRIGISNGAWRVNDSDGGTLGGSVQDASGFSIIATTGEG